MITIKLCHISHPCLNRMHQICSCLLEDPEIKAVVSMKICKQAALYRKVNTLIRWPWQNCVCDSKMSFWTSSHAFLFFFFCFSFFLVSFLFTTGFGFALMPYINTRVFTLDAPKEDKASWNRLLSLCAIKTIIRDLFFPFPCLPTSCQYSLSYCTYCSFLEFGGEEGGRGVVLYRATFQYGQVWRHAFFTVG